MVFSSNETLLKGSKVCLENRTVAFFSAQFQDSVVYPHILKKENSYLYSFIHLDVHTHVYTHVYVCAFFKA